MKFRTSTATDLAQLVAIIEQAKDYLKSCGVNQWQTGYPNVESLQQDILNQLSYVLVEDEEIIASAAVSFEEEETYQLIYDGQWLSEMPYAVVHRFVVKDCLKSKGIGSCLLKEIEHLCLKQHIKSIKIDTHEDNIAMQHLLKKNEFTFCGIIYLADGDKRLAFEKLI